MSTPEQPDVERLRQALASLGDQSQWPDVDAERLFAALHGEIDAEARRRIVDELIENPRAAAVWRLARELDPVEASTAATAPLAPTTKTRSWTWLPIAATLLLAVGGVWQFVPRESDAPTYRSSEIRRIDSLLPEGGRLSRAEPSLRWSAIAGARYRVRVLTPGLDVLDESEDLETATYRLSPTVLSRIPAGGRLLWQVEAKTAGTDPIVSPTFSATLD
jgi:hypothetical protein